MAWIFYSVGHQLPCILGLWPLGVVLVFELLSGFLAIECPIDRDAISVGSPVPGAGFRPENPDLAESALPQTLLGKEADLQFRLIQQTSVYRRVDRKSTRLNSSHLVISYAVFCLK